jgi:hypothetical protein
MKEFRRADKWEKRKEGEGGKRAASREAEMFWGQQDK